MLARRSNPAGTRNFQQTAVGDVGSGLAVMGHARIPANARAQYACKGCMSMLIALFKKNTDKRVSAFICVAFGVFTNVASCDRKRLHFRATPMSFDVSHINENEQSR
jgi:hypothetical protein